VAYGDHGGQRPGARKRRLENDTLPPEGWQAFRRGWAEQLLANVDGALYICMGTIGTAWASGPSLAQLRAPATPSTLCLAAIAALGKLLARSWGSRPGF